MDIIVRDPECHWSCIFYAVVKMWHARLLHDGRWITHEPTTRAAHCIEHLLFAVAEVLPAHQRKHQRGQLRIEQLTLSRTAAVGLVVESA